MERAMAAGSGELTTRVARRCGISTFSV